MSVPTPSIPPALQRVAAVPTDLIWRLRVDQYQAMIRAGILTDDDPVELLEGWLVTKIPKNPQQRVVMQLTREALALSCLPAGMLMPKNLLRL